MIHSQSLDELEELVCQLFGEIVNKEVARPVYERVPFSPDYTQRRFNVRLSRGR